MQLGRGEPIKDTARVLGRMVHGAVIRTYDHQDVMDFAHFGNIPTINALTDHAHPCQIMADLMTIRSKLGDLSNKVITFVGDGACNVATSWIYAAMKFGFELRIASPKAFSPDASLIAQAGDKIKVIHRMDEAVAGSHVLYTDVWVSMGKRRSQLRLKEFEPYQINTAIMNQALPGARRSVCPRIAVRRSPRRFLKDMLIRFSNRLKTDCTLKRPS